MNKSVLIMFFILLVTLKKAKPSSNHVNKSKIEKTCNHLTPSNCDFLEMKRFLGPERKVTVTTRDLACKNRFNQKTLAELRRFHDGCMLPLVTSNKVKHMITISIRSSKHSPIINDSFKIFQLRNFLTAKHGLRLINFKGFDIESKITVSVEWLEFHLTFDLYKQNQLVKSCADFEHSKSEEFIFQSDKRDESSNDYLINSVYFFKSQSKFPMCSLFFRKARIFNLNFFNLANTFYLKNTVAFTDPIGIHFDLDSKILQFEFYEVYGIDIDSKLLNPSIFAQMKDFKLYGHFKSIETIVFKPFEHLKQVLFYSTQTLQVIRKQGIGWIQNINSHIEVDYRNKTDILKHMDSIVNIYLAPDREFYSDVNNHMIYDQDFCLFAHFPFQQLVNIRLGFYEDVLAFRSKTKYSCTELWISQYFLDVEYVFYPQKNLKLKESNFTACEFEKRLKMCNKTDFSFKKTSSYTSYDRLIAFEYTTIILASLFAFIGLFTNSMTILVILSKKNKEIMREKHYLYMNLHCAFNMLICFIQVLSLVNECQYPFGFFCSSVRHIIGIQYIKIIFGEFLSCVCRLMSNFTYLGFSLCRITKIGKDHDRFTLFINDMSMKKYIIFSFIASVGLSFSKLFQFRFNLDYQLMLYPYSVFEFSIGWQMIPLYIAIFVANIFFYILNYSLFVLVHLIVDLMLIRKLWVVLREKEEKLRELTGKNMEDESKNNEESRRRVIFMVIFNSTLNFCTKLPMMITSVNDLRLLIHKTYVNNDSYYDITRTNILYNFQTFITFKYLCWTQKSCIIFQSFGNCLFLFSLTTILFFLKCFDRNFKTAFSNVFNIRKIKNQISKKIR